MAVLQCTRLCSFCYGVYYVRTCGRFRYNGAEIVTPSICIISCPRTDAIIMLSVLQINGLDYLLFIGGGGGGMMGKK